MAGYCNFESWPVAALLLCLKRAMARCGSAFTRIPAAQSAIFGAGLYIVTGATCWQPALKPCTKTTRERSGLARRTVFGDGDPALQNFSPFATSPLGS